MRTIADLTLYEIPDLAAALGIHPVTARRYLAEGRIPARKAGRAWLVAEEALRAFFHVAPAGTAPALITPAAAPARPRKGAAVARSKRSGKPSPAGKRS